MVFPPYGYNIIILVKKQNSSQKCNFIQKKVIVFTVFYCNNQKTIDGYL